MTNKIISSMILTTVIVFWILGNANPDNLLFLFVSANPLVALSRIVLAIGMVVLSYKNLLFHSRLRLAAKYTGLSLIAFGTLLMAITPLGSAVYDYAKLLDWMIIAEAGIVFTSCALTLPQPTGKKLARAKSQKAKLRSRTA